MNWSLFITKWMRWEQGRQGTGYDKMLIWIGYFPLPFDCYILRFPTGCEIPPHKDAVKEGRHYRLNIVLWAATKGGNFICQNVLYSNRFMNLFRPDIEEHSVTKIEEGARYVFSVGWLIL
jgi:hypothetical protein